MYNLTIVKKEYDFQTLLFAITLSFSTEVPVTTSAIPSSSLPTTILSTAIYVTSNPTESEVITSTENIISDTTNTGYIIDIPEDPITFPTKPQIDTTTTTELVTETSSTGYIIEEPDNPLTLPSKPKTISTSTTEKSIQTSTGYVISTPENPLTFPPKSEGKTILEVIVRRKFLFINE